MFSFPQTVMQAQQELQDGIQAGSRPSAFGQQGVMPAPSPQKAPPPFDPMQMAMMQQMGGMPQMSGMPPQQGGMPMAQPMPPVQQFAKGGLAVWDRPAPKGKSKPLSSKKKAAAKRRAKAAGRPYPNLVDNLAVRK